MTAFLAGNTKFYIGGVKAPAVYDDLLASSFNSEAWTEIRGVESIGAFGEASEVVAANAMGQKRPLKLSGQEDPGTIEMVLNFNSADAGQLALVAARKAKENRAFRVVMDDAPAGGTPSERLFVALVTAAPEQLDTVNAVTKVNAALAINSNVVKVAAAGAGSAPVNTVLPAISGTAETGETLTATSGTWTGSPTPSYGYQWFSGGESIPGATASTYAIEASDEGNTITVLVTATNVNGVAYAMSAATATVTDGA